LTARSVESQHEVRTKPLAQRVLRYKPFELADEPAVVAEYEPRLDELFTRGGSQFLQSRNISLNSGFERKICKRRAAPQVERRLELGRSMFGRVGGARIREQVLETMKIEALVFHVDRVAGGHRPHHVRPERLAELGDLVLQRAQGCLRRLLAPDVGQQPVSRGELARA